MARKGITYEQVAKVANELVSNGERPTTRLIRKKLETGSPNTLQKHLFLWLNDNPATAPRLPANPTLKKAKSDVPTDDISEHIRLIAKQALRIEQEQQAVEAARHELAIAQQAIETQNEKINELTLEIQRLRCALNASEQVEQALKQCPSHPPKQGVQVPAPPIKSPYFFESFGKII